MKRLVGIAVFAVLMTATSGVAFAGEVTGNNKPLWTNEATPEHPHHTLHGKSACAFSGLEDWTGEGEQGLNEVAVTPGVTQTPHEVDGFNPPPGTAGVACNPTKAVPE